MNVANGTRYGSKSLPSLPEATARAARAVFNIENLYLSIGDNLDHLLENVVLSSLDAKKTFHPRALNLLVLVTIFQFAEDMGDRRASAELNRRTDWKYALHLSLHDPGLDPARLCEFRRQLIDEAAGLEAFQCLLERFAAVGLLGRGKRGVCAASVLEYLCRLTQLEHLFEAVCQVIEALASHYPDVLRSLAQPHRYQRYQGGERRSGEPPSAIQQQARGDDLVADAWHLLQIVAGIPDRQARELAEVTRLSAIWKKQYQGQGNTLVWRNASCNLCPLLAEESPCEPRHPSDEVDNGSHSSGEGVSVFIKGTQELR